MPTASTSPLGNDMVSKYSFLLQPIRDLTKNWDIDVAAQLEEYLNEIEKIQISFDGGKTTMNFAEAALVIQGSACIYSKKVEYLYTLVYQTLDLIASKKRLQQAASVDNKGKDKDVSIPQEEEFLLLDDIQESKNIDLKDDDVESEASRIIPRTPLALIPLGERDRQDMLLSHTGEVLGSRNDFKMNTCTVHASGALLLDLGNLTLADSSLKMLVTSTPQSNGLIPGIASDNQQKDQPMVEPVDEQFAAPDINMDNHDAGNSDDDDDAGGGDEMYDDCADDYQEEEQEPEKMELRNRDRQQQQQYQRHKLQVQDSWELLDPHNPGKHEEKPFKKGRSFKLPASLLEISKKENKKRKRNETIEKKQVLIPIQEFCTTAFYSHASKFPKNPLKAPIYKEFEYLYWIEFRRRQELEKKQKKNLAEYLTQDQIEDLNSVVPEYKELGQPEGDIPVCGPECNDDYADDDEDNNCFDGPENNMADNDHLIAPEGLKEELVVSGYEDLVRKYVEGYLLEAQHYAKETDLSRRVHEWEKRILPTLELEETHRAFDIHLYGSEILSSFQDKEAMPFSDIMKSKEPYEICRYFLAALQLANNYNVEVSTEDKMDQVPDTMRLKLLHKTAAHDAIRTFRAPSVKT